MFRTTRRQVLQIAAWGAGAVVARAGRPVRGANEKLDVGVVGVGGRGAANLDAVAQENVVALCDVDARHLAAAGERFGRAARYADFRRMLDGHALDAVVVSTPDHTHAVVASAAMRAGAHVYCEKPLAHTVREARALADLAKAEGRVTQMGTQIHAGENYRRVVELVKSGAIGPVSAVHVFCDKDWSASEPPSGEHAVPAHLDYDIWLGPAQPVPFHPTFHPASWRRYWAFGGGTIADMACHYLDLAFWALALRDPIAVEADGPEPHPQCASRDLVVRWRFPARGAQPPVDVTWYDGARRPALLAEIGRDAWTSGVLFVGERGMLLADYGRRELLPESDFESFAPPVPFVPPSIGHHAEWIEASKAGRAATTCAFHYAGPLTESVLLGVVAHRARERFDWDASELTAKGAERAGALLHRDYREGWTL